MMGLKQTDERIAARRVMPLVSVHETDTEVVLEAEMPGLVREDITVDVKADELTIRSTVRSVEVPKGFTALYRERLPVEYERTFMLADSVDKGKIKAAYENGVLRLTLAKSAQTQPRRITIS